MSTDKHDPWALLREARESVRFEARERANTDCDRRESQARFDFLSRIDAALASHDAVPLSEDRLTAELYRTKSRPVEAEFSRLDTMWQQLVRERDEAKAKVHEAFGDAFSAMSEKLRYSSDAYIERITKAAFKRGMAAMREAAAKELEDTDFCGTEAYVLRIRTLPDPEDKP